MSRQKSPNKFLDITSTTGYNTKSTTKLGSSYPNQGQLVSPEANGMCFYNRAEFNLNQVTQLTAAQVLALYATPIQLVPAPGAGYAVIVKGYSAWTAGGTAYTIGSTSDNLALKYTNASGALAAAITNTTGFLDQTSAQLRYAGPLGGLSSAATTTEDITPVANAAIVANILNANITVGNQPINIQVFYDIIPVDLTVSA